MHRSRLGTVVIDCDDFDAGIRFWAGVLGVPDDAILREDPYASLGHVAGDLRVLIQRVPEPKTAKTRLHLDLETDDLDAEVARVEALGATKQRSLDEGAWVMEDICGNEFCVIPPETPGFPERAVTWDE